MALDTNAKDGGILTEFSSWREATMVLNYWNLGIFTGFMRGITNWNRQAATLATLTRPWAFSYWHSTGVTSLVIMDEVSPLTRHRRQSLLRAGRATEGGKLKKGGNIFNPERCYER